MKDCRKDARRRPRFDGAQALQLAGVVAALVLAAVVNVLGARHFTRWDWTRDRRWSLSPATVETLRTLEQPVDVWAVAGQGDPLEQSLQQLLDHLRGTATNTEFLRHLARSVPQG